MDARRPTPPAAPPLQGPVFVARRPDRVPPERLPTAELESSIHSLRRKVRSARSALFITRIGGALLSTALIVTGFVLLWFGPKPFVELLTGSRAIITTYDLMLWWSIVVVICVLGGAFGDQLLRGRLRLVRGWAHRVDELSNRLEHAEAERQRRPLAPPSRSKRDQRGKR